MDDADRADARSQCHICGSSTRFPATLCPRCAVVLGQVTPAEAALVAP